MVSGVLSFQNVGLLRQAADLSGGVGAAKYSDEEMTKAVEILASRADYLAQQLEIKDDRGPHYRDWSGTAHLILRSIIEPTKRLADGEANENKAKGAFGTSSFLINKKDKLDEARENGDQAAIDAAGQEYQQAISGMLCEDPMRLASISSKVAKMEMMTADPEMPINAKVEDAISQADFNYAVAALYLFTREIEQTLRVGKAENQEDLEKYAKCLDKAVKWVAKIHKEIEPKLAQKDLVHAGATPKAGKPRP